MEREKMLELAQKAENELHSFKRFKIGRDCESALKPSEHFTMRMLHTINEGKKVMPSQLAKKMDLSMPAITHQLKALEKHGYVVRETSTSDRRRVYVSISKEGYELFERIKERHREFMCGLIEFLGEEDSEKFLMLITRVAEYIKRAKGAMKTDV
jgi:DNA-binding MarR family transcriptional regulator